ncbi:MAG: hypothetical protein ACI92S_001510 [Planctomycetaceae bacterium]|jgi:hypothetical protein
MTDHQSARHRTLASVSRFGPPQMPIWTSFDTYRRPITWCAAFFSLTFFFNAAASVAEDGSIVEPFGSHPQAMKWLAQELTKAQVARPLLVVWLLDETKSMETDFHETAETVHRVYGELHKDTQSVVISFGTGTHVRTNEPVATTPTGFSRLRKAFDRKPTDESGKENLCKAVLFAIDKFSEQANENRQQLLIIAVTNESPSDSGDTAADPNLLEQTIKQCQKSKVPVYLLGRESTFGKPWARIAWKDPVFQLTHWVWIHRGPDSALPARLAWNGRGKSLDNTLSGFGPYSQERLCHATSGGFFLLLPSGNVVGFRNRRAALASYHPVLVDRKTEQLAISQSPFRASCQFVIESLDPALDARLILRETFSTTNFDDEAQQDLTNAEYAWAKLNAAITQLASVRPLREPEPSKRWQANYDLLYAQCLAFRVRLVQYMLALDNHRQQSPAASTTKHNKWMLGQSIAPLLEPSIDQFSRLNKLCHPLEARDDFVIRMQNDRAAAQQAIDQVIAAHPDSPWATVAEIEKRHSFGLKLRSYFHDPRYQHVGKKVKAPSF